MTVTPHERNQAGDLVHGSESLNCAGVWRVDLIGQSTIGTETAAWCNQLPTMNMRILAHRPCKPRLISSEVTRALQTSFRKLTCLMSGNRPSKVTQALQTSFQQLTFFMSGNRPSKLTLLVSHLLSPLSFLLSLAQRESKSNDRSALRDHDPCDC